MEFNWTTFLLETINFLVLVWILKRFLFVPVKGIIEQRRLSIEKKIQDAEKAKAEAQDLRLKYENRLKDWEQEKAREKVNFQKGLDDEKNRQMILLEESLTKDKERRKAQEQRQLTEILDKNEKTALLQSLKFLSRLFATFAGPEIEEKIIDWTLKGISEPSSREMALLRSGFAGQNPEVKIKSAYALKKDQKEKLVGSLKSALKVEPVVCLEIEPKLQAGLEVTCGSVVIQANLRDELRAFAEVGGHE